MNIDPGESTEHVQARHIESLESELAASQREREQLQEIIATKNRQELQLQARVEAAEKLAERWEG